LDAIIGNATARRWMLVYTVLLFSTQISARCSRCAGRMSRSTPSHAGTSPFLETSQMSASVNPQYLLEGAVYALEQCGLLLRDANLLYRNGSYASAVALAAFAREELGRWRILLDLRRKVLGGRHLTIKEIQTHCVDHVHKQGAGMTSITMRADWNSGLGKLLQTRMSATPGSKEWKAAYEQIEKLNRQKKKRVPDERHRQRMSALYVDAVPGRWNRPAEISQSHASNFLQDAVNDYCQQYWQGYIHTELEIIKYGDPELFHALVQWSDRPELPRPEWQDDVLPR
jgi:AbiV family abortive infection protein